MRTSVEKGDKVKVSLRFRGREMAHVDSMKDRIGLRSMLDVVENGRIEAVMVRDLEQISRNSYILVGVIEIQPAENHDGRRPRYPADGSRWPEW